jgi:hypothetical protein
MRRYRAILIDSPWQQETITGFTHPRNRRPDRMLNKQSVGNAIDGKDIFDALEGLKGGAVALTSTGFQVDNQPTPPTKQDNEDRWV